MRDPEHFLQQARAKFRVISALETREFLAGKRDVLPGMLNQRETLDAIRRAYEAGLKDGREDR